MPLTRYQIRNEYSLADPELYGAADKDDPEALLEGVAMAGLVGVLRQLGDLAEFAAEIFHDLHEEVMATAARGHGLMVRVQQLETDFPSIEKAFLSQTSHSLFFYDPGVDWHPNLRMDQNLITQGDLPRFVMDSYEECRGPPRLFLLDKFDVAGAGACLKRYTDPSFFKDSSSSGVTKAEVYREKKPRKAKKKGSRWRNGETPEILPTSHAKLHQLFLEESIGNYVNDPARHVKLKRRLNGFPFDTKTGKSYMEKILKTPTPDHNVRDISVNSSPLRLPSNSTGETGIEILEIGTVNTGKELPWRKRSPSLAPDAEKTRQKPSIDELNEEVDYGISVVPNRNPISEADSVYEVLEEKEVAADREKKIEGSVDSYQSDDIASEVENYVDALTTMDSEVETDECKAKNDMHLVMNPDASVELLDLQAHFSDSQSVGNSTATDDENSSSRKGISSFLYSDSLSNSAENAPSDGDVSANIPPSKGAPEAESVNMSLDQAAERIVSNGVCTDESTSCLSDSTILPEKIGKSSMEGESVGLESDGVSSDTGYLNPEENTAYLGDNLPCTSKCSDSPSQTGHDFLHELSSENHSVYELDNEDSHILSHSSGKKCSENSVDYVVQAEYAEDECSEITVGNQIDYSHSVASQEKLLYSALPELETWHPDMKPNGVVYEADDAPPLPWETEISSIPVVLSPEPADFSKQQFPGISENVSPLEIDSADVGFQYYGEKNLDKASNAADGEEIGESPHDKHIFVEDAADLELPSDLPGSPDPPPVPDVHLEDITTATVHSECVMVDKAVADTHFNCNEDDGKALSGSPTKLQEESVFIIQESRVNVIEINKSCSQEHLQDSGTEKVADQQGIASSILESVLLSSVSCDDSNSEVLNTVPNSTLSAPSRSSLQIVNATTVPLSSDQHEQQSESKSAQEISFFEDAEDDQKVKLQSESESSQEISFIEGAEDDQKVELQDDQFDVISQHDQDDVPTVCLLTSNSLPPVLSSDQHDQLSESKYARQDYIVEDTEDDVSSYNHHIVELRTSLEQQLDLQEDQYDAASRHGQDSQSNYSCESTVVENAEDAASSPTHHIVELKTPLEQKVEQHDQFDGEYLRSDKTSSDPVMESIQSPNHPDASSELCAAHLSCEPSVLEVLPQLDVSIKAKEPAFNVLPSFGQLTEVSQINMDEMPPLPPLPPMQWRIGRVQHASLASKRDSEGRHLDSFPAMLVSTTDKNTQLGLVATAEEIAQPSNPFLPRSALKGEISQHSNENLGDCMVHSNPLSLPAVNGEHYIPTLDKPQSTNPVLVLPTISGERSEHGFDASERETAQPSKSLPGDLDHSLHQPEPERSLEDEKLQGASMISDGKVMNPVDTTSPSPTMQDDQPHHVFSMSGEQNPWSLGTSIPLVSFEYGKPNGNRPMKLPRPRNPLIDAVVAHDKSKMRKVTERVHSRIEQKIEERDSLLEQIRTKSFNLKPAVLTRPSIQGPKTNLKVSAILEKAKTIRQALAGSDEDDDADSWSDS